MAALPDDAFFTIQEVAQLLKCTVATVRTMIRTGELEAFRVRRHWRVSHESLQRVIDLHSSGTTTPPTDPAAGQDSLC